MRHASMTRLTAEEIERMEDHTAYARLDAMTDDDIAEAAASDPDCAPTHADV